MGQAQERFANLHEIETRYANLPVAVALKYDADFDAVATNLEAAAKFDAHVQEQVSSALGIPKTAGKKFSDLKLSESRDSRSTPMELTTQNFCSASYVSSARQCDCGSSAEKGDNAGGRQQPFQTRSHGATSWPSHPCSACARAGRNGQ